jgi:2-phospho-L-lactate guanylyltransferase (CobY/MobA/RfbA family)
METQTVINIVIGAFGTLLGAMLKAVWDAVKDLQTADKTIVKDVAELQVLVAGTYIKRDEFEKLSHAIFAKLDKIMEKLDGKVDRTECERFHDK